MRSSWCSSVLPIAAIFSFRMLGLFMLIPVFTVLALSLKGATPSLIGIALGAYGLSQGLLQIPFGLLSDRYGRKAIISLGLILFCVGSLLGAHAESIYTIIIARFIQGMGAIGSVLIALLSDLTLEDERTKAMAVIGMSIGISFSLAMVLSPLLSHQFGLTGIFYFTFVLSILGLIILHFVIPKNSQKIAYNYSELFKSVFFNLSLQRLNFGIFCQHIILTSTFFILPILLKHYRLEGSISAEWHFYLPLIISSFILMVPFLLIGERKSYRPSIFIFSLIIVSITQFFLAFFHAHWLPFCCLCLLYFIAFNLLEASLPSLVSKVASPQNRGTAMGVYSSSQFLGIFVGGLIAGLIFQYFNIRAIFFTNSLIAIFWIKSSLTMKQTLSLSKDSEALRNLS